MSKSKTYNILLAFSSALLGITGIAVASGQHSGGHDAGIGHEGTFGEVTRTIQIEVMDNYFDPESIDVKPGETIRFNIKNNGEFVHEFNIGTASMHAEHQKEMLQMMQHGALGFDKIDHDKMMMDMGNGQTMQHDDPNSVLLEPGQSAEVIWTFENASNLQFACNVPGHYESGMVGEFHMMD